VGNLKWAIVALIVGGAAYFGYDYYSKLDREAQRDHCAKLEQCLAYSAFVGEYSSFEFCEKSEKVAREMRAFEGCDPELECSEWLACGETTGGFLPKRDPDKKTNFDEIESALED
jgi:hypothetical protein